MKYVPRLTAPTKDNKYYISPSFNPFCYNYDLWKLGGNCTSYAYGRFAELLGRKPEGLPTSNAENWYKNVKYFEKGSIPKLGSIVVWSKGIIGNGKDGAGHVAVVEQINSDGSILVSESGYCSFLFRTRTLKAPYTLNGYKLQGFIYLPLEFETGSNTYPGVFPDFPNRGYFKLGDRGNNVKNLQSLLNWILNTNLAIDGIIGTKTLNAIKNYQKMYSLKVDGYFGSACMAKAKTIKK